MYELKEITWTCPNCGHKQQIVVMVPEPEAVSMVCGECGKRGICKTGEGEQ